MDEGEEVSFWFLRILKRSHNLFYFFGGRNVYLSSFKGRKKITNQKMKILRKKKERFPPKRSVITSCVLLFGVRWMGEWVGSDSKWSKRSVEKWTWAQYSQTCTFVFLSITSPHSNHWWVAISSISHHNRLIGWQLAVISSDIMTRVEAHRMRPIFTRYHVPPITKSHTSVENPHRLIHAIICHRTKSHTECRKGPVGFEPIAGFKDTYAVSLQRVG